MTRPNPHGRPPQDGAPPSIVFPKHEVARLSANVYADLERKAGSLVVTRETTALQASYQLGIQHVLRILREGFTIGL